MSDRSVDSLLAEVENLRLQLAEAQDTIRAIQGGEVDAVLIHGSDQPAVFTLDSADKPYRLLVEQMHQGAATLTTGGLVLYCNQRFADLVRRPLDSLLGRAVREVVDAPYLPLFDALLKDGLATGVEGEVMLCRGDGTLVPVFLGVSALREGAAGVCLIVADLTEQKRRERLVADEAMARSILEQVADAVIVCDAGGTVVRASRTAHALCGVNPIMRPFAESFPLERVQPDTSETVPLDVGAAWQGETLRGWEVRLPRPSGGPADLLLSAGPLIAAGGDVLGVVVTLTDITALRCAEVELRRRATELEEMDQRKDEFLAMLAHELRNPLSPIRSSLEVMHLLELDDPRLRRCREVIGRQTQQLTRLVDDLLEVSRINSGKIQLRREPIDLAMIVSNAVEVSRPLVDAKGHRLVVVAPATPVWLNADPARLSQVIGNLINNAAKYTEDGGRIDLTTVVEGGEAVVRVSDTGVGISGDMLTRVFDLFTQVDRSLDRSQGGLGIGLALVKRLVMMHGGRVEAKSGGPGRGSEFIVRLPLAATAPTPAIDRPGVSRDAAPCRVLVVDDNKDAADSMATLLSMIGHEVRIARDGMAALVAAAEFRPQVMLCDIGLPLLNGYEVVGRLSRDPQLTGTRFIAITGYGREEDVREARTAGFHAHLVKPVQFDKLQSILNGTD